MYLHWIDWLVIAVSIVVTLWIGVIYTRRAQKSVDEYFLAGRKLTWWLAGTSMVATTFAADTPLVVSGWVREYGIWKNWLWWCYAAGGFLTVFLFARYWRRGGVMTTAELAELRYGGDAARRLRGCLGVYHSLFTNEIVLCWVVLAGTKILGVLLDVDKTMAIVVLCVISVAYAIMSGLWGLVFTDVFQFGLAMAGSILLGFIAWAAVGGREGVLGAAASVAGFQAETLSFLPSHGPGGLLDATFWTAPVAALFVYLGVAWWGVESIDGGGFIVQRISASKNESEGMLACLWFNVAHYALRPWPWIMVALASMIVLPAREVTAPRAGEVHSAAANCIVLSPASNGPQTRLALASDGGKGEWRPQAIVSAGDKVAQGQVLARTDAESAYVVMMLRYLPVGLLGLAVAALLAAFMSTVDTHINLAASFFVNDVYRRFLRKDAGPAHYVKVARFASAGVMALAGLLCAGASSISDLFLFFLAFLSGVGPVYILRWTWWRVRASTEITAMLASSTATVIVTYARIHWSLGALSQDGKLAPEGRLCIAVGFSLVCALLSMAFTAQPEPEKLVEFYRKVRPIGAWGPVRKLADDVEPRHELVVVMVGVVGGLGATFGLLFGLGHWLIGTTSGAVICALVAVGGGALVFWALRRLQDTPRGVGV